MQRARSHQSRPWRIGFQQQTSGRERFLPSVFICRDVSLLPFRAETIHPLNQFWPALAVLAAICGAALQPDSKLGRTLI